MNSVGFCSYRGIVRVGGKGRKGEGNGLNYDPLRNLWIGGGREEANANARDSR